MTQGLRVSVEYSCDTVVVYVAHLLAFLSIFPVMIGAIFALINLDINAIYIIGFTCIFPLFTFGHLYALYYLFRKIVPKYKLLLKKILKNTHVA